MRLVDMVHPGYCEFNIGETIGQQRKIVRHNLKHPPPMELFHGLPSTDAGQVEHRPVEFSRYGPLPIVGMVRENKSFHFKIPVCERNAPLKRIETSQRGVVREGRLEHSPVIIGRGDHGGPPMEERVDCRTVCRFIGVGIYHTRDEFR